MSIPMNSISSCQLLYCFIQVQHQHWIFCRFSCPLISLKTYFSPRLLRFFAKSLSHSGLTPCLSSFKYCWSHTAFVNNPFDFQMNFFLQCKSWHSLNFTHPNPVLDVTAISHPPIEFILSHRHKNSATVSTSSCNFTSDHPRFVIPFAFPTSKIYCKSIR